MIQVGITTQSTDKNVMNPVSPVKDPQNSYLTKNFLEWLDSVAKSSCNGNKSSKNTEVGNLHQSMNLMEVLFASIPVVHSENLESYTKCCNEESVLGSWSRAAETCHERVGVMEDCTEVKNSREAGRCPSFDLGFD
ncbi:hypothetical protein GOBAR_DD11957 [Gossypium barbadense]|nr:hypothetical protein GOBAR_DD11957 [Gossypium barbadense]